MRDTVTQNLGMHSDTEMGAIGWLVALGSLFMLIPLLPFIAVASLVAARRGGEDTETTSEQLFGENATDYPRI